MTSDAILVLGSLFGVIWRLFTSWYFPGTNVTPAVAFMFLLAAALGLRFIRRLTSVSSEE